MSSRCFHGSGYGIAAPAHPRRWLRSLVACAVGTVAVWATLAVVLGVEVDQSLAASAESITRSRH